MKLSYKYDVHSSKGTITFVANSLKLAREYKKALKVTDKKAYIVKQQYMPIFGKVVS
jgi:hypothetical protein